MLWSIVTIGIFIGVGKLLKHLNMGFINPIIVTLGLLVAGVYFSHTPYEIYSQETYWITYLLGPIVVMLAIPLYKNREDLKKSFQAIGIGVITSIVVSTVLVIGLSWAFGLDSEIMLSMIPKSITTPMAIEVTNMVGGMSGLTIISVIITGIIGASLAPWTLKLFKVEHPIAKGIGIGTSSHGIGTSKAVEMDDEVGAASGLAMGIAGVTTVLTFSIIAKFL